MRRTCSLLIHLTILLWCGAVGTTSALAQQCASRSGDVCSFGINDGFGGTSGFQGQAYNQSLFWAGIDGMWLTHSGSSFRSEVLDPNNNSVVVSQTLEHGFPMTPRFRLGSLLTEALRAELTYFGTTGWESTAQIQNVAPVPDLDATIHYDAELQNFECNLFTTQSKYDPFWSIGLRYLRYKDSFTESYRLNPGVGALIEEVAAGEATNDLFGPQLGMGYGLLGGMIRFGGKVGFMNNRINQTGPSYTNAILIDGNPETSFDNESDTFVLLGDLDLTLTRYLTPNFSVRVGYQGLFLDNVAQSATQNGAQASPDNIAFHGLVFGAELYH